MEDKYVKKVVESVVLDFYRSGLLTEDDIKDSNNLKRAIRKIISKKNVLTQFTTDHRITLLKNAEFFLIKKDFELANLFYATYFEHVANSIIDTSCANNNLKIDTKKEIIRSTSIISKYSWLLELFKLPKFKLEHLQVIRKVCDDRNAFVHYKWVEDPSFNKLPDELSAEENLIIEEFNKIKKTVKYVKLYLSRVNFKGNKQRIIVNI
jgi:hypothetical protein